MTTVNLKDLQEFEEKAASHKTPSKASRLESKIEPFESQCDWKEWEKEVLGGRASLNLSGSAFSETVENQFKAVQNILEDVVKQVNNNHAELSKSVRMLEFEKGKLKREIGNKNQEFINPEYETSSIWGTLGSMSEVMVEHSKTGTSSRSLVEAEREISSLSKTCTIQELEIKDLRTVVRSLADRISDMEVK